MKTELNLIPLTYRAQLKRVRLFALLRSALIAVLLYLIVVAIVLLVTRITLQRHFVKIVGETTLVTRENRSIESAVRELNEKIIEADKVESYARPWAEFIVQLNGLVPPGIRIRSLQLSATGPSTIEGVSSSRESLIELRNRLSLNPKLKNVDLPVNTLFTRENIEFKITFTTEVKP